LIGDGRNDENAIVSQLHLLFIRLHNKVVRGLRKAHPHMSCNALFEGAQRIVRWHYQWVVITDFLPKIVGKAMARSVLPTSAALPGEAAIPVEFSGAAYRFGHSMVRQEYRVQRCHPRGTPILGDPDDGREDLTGFRRLKASLAVEWDLFFFDTKTADELANLSMCIDPSLALPLFSLPPDGASLAELNLQRGRSLGLPAGADVAEALGVRCLSEAELTPQRLLPGIDTLEGIESLLEAPPLWYYILCESHSRGGAASAKGVNLGEVGGRIVAEVLVGLVERDPRSYIHQPEWTPHLNDGEWRSMVDLVKFVEAPADD
jgi:hypothetical protein